MKITLVSIFVLIGCTLVWAYQIHRDVNILQQQCAALTTDNESLKNENGTLITNTKTLSDEIVQLKSANNTITTSIKSLGDQVAQLNEKISQSKTAPPATSKQKKTKKAHK